MLLDYETMNKDVLICFLNMSMCGSANVRFKERMVYEKLSDAITISEEAFAILVFENGFQRWEYQARMERDKKIKEKTSKQIKKKKKEKQTNDDGNESDEDSIEANDIENGSNHANDQTIPKVLYQRNVTSKKSKNHTAGKWLDKGIKRYNELLVMVKNSRNSNWRTEFENDLQQRYINDADDNNLESYNRKRKKEGETLKTKKVRVQAMNMFDAMGM